MKQIFKVYRLLGTIGLMIVCLLAIVRLQQEKIRPKTEILTKADYLKQEQVEKLKIDVFKGVPSWGFNNLISDWLYLGFIQYFGDSTARETIGYSLSSDYFQAIVERDPRFVDAHIKLDSATAIFAGEPRKSVDYLEKSLEFVTPKMTGNVILPYYLWVSKGIDELLFLGDIKSAKNSYSMGAKWAEEYDDPASKNLAIKMRGTVEFLKKNPGSKIPQIGAWMLVLSSSADQKTQQRALQEIQALGGQIIMTPEGKLTIKIPKEIK